MNSYRINYIDGHDLHYKSIEVPAESEEAAISAIWDMYDADYDHHIVEVIKTDKVSELNMRIGSITAPPLTPTTRQVLSDLACASE